MGKYKSNRGVWSFWAFQRPNIPPPLGPLCPSSGPSQAHRAEYGGFKGGGILQRKKVTKFFYRFPLRHIVRLGGALEGRRQLFNFRQILGIWLWENCEPLYLPIFLGLNIEHSYGGRRVLRPPFLAWRQQRPWPLKRARQHQKNIYAKVTEKLISAENHFCSGCLVSGVAGGKRNKKKKGRNTGVWNWHVAWH